MMFAVCGLIRWNQFILNHFMTFNMCSEPRHNGVLPSRQIHNFFNYAKQS